MDTTTIDCLKAICALDRAKFVDRDVTLTNMCTTAWRDAIARRDADG